MEGESIQADLRTRGELGISKDDLYLSAQERLAFKRQTRFLKELTQSDEIQVNTAFKIQQGDDYTSACGSPSRIMLPVSEKF